MKTLRAVPAIAVFVLAGSAGTGLCALTLDDGDLDTSVPESDVFDAAFGFFPEETDVTNSSSRTNETGNGSAKAPSGADSSGSTPSVRGAPFVELPFALAVPLAVAFLGSRGRRGA